MSEKMFGINICSVTDLFSLMFGMYSDITVSYRVFNLLVWKEICQKTLGGEYYQEMKAK